MEERDFIGYIASIDELSPSLRAEADAAIAAGYKATATYVAVYGSETTKLLGSLMVLELPDHGRVAIEEGGDPTWASYSSLRAAVDDYLNDPETYYARN